MPANVQRQAVQENRVTIPVLQVPQVKTIRVLQEQLKTHLILQILMAKEPHREVRVVHRRQEMVQIRDLQEVVTRVELQAQVALIVPDQEVLQEEIIPPEVLTIAVDQVADILIIEIQVVELHRVHLQEVAALREVIVHLRAVPDLQELRVHRDQIHLDLQVLLDPIARQKAQDLQVEAHLREVTLLQADRVGRAEVHRLLEVIAHQADLQVEVLLHREVTVRLQDLAEVHHLQEAIALQDQVVHPREEVHQVVLPEVLRQEGDR